MLVVETGGEWRVWSLESEGFLVSSKALVQSPMTKSKPSREAGQPQKGTSACAGEGTLGSGRTVLPGESPQVGLTVASVLPL